jgi:hypothetical protein
MSTRANVVIKDQYHKLWFYRHSDGYPEGTLPTLEKFVRWINEGKIRNNASQAAGWLILIGAEEYNYAYDKQGKQAQLPAEKAFSPENKEGWKCGAYEPTGGQHGDIKYLYTIDLSQTPVEIKVQKIPFDS